MLKVATSLIGITVITLLLWGIAGVQVLNKIRDGDAKLSDRITQLKQQISKQDQLID